MSNETTSYQEDDLCPGKLKNNGSEKPDGSSSKHEGVRFPPKDEYFAQCVSLQKVPYFEI